MQYQRRTRSLIADAVTDADSDPMTSAINLLDLALVFIVVVVSILTTLKVPDLLRNAGNVTVIKNYGEKDMEIVIKEGKSIKAYRATEFSSSGKAERLGVAYRLENGQIVYAPEPAPPAPGNR